MHDKMFNNMRDDKEREQALLSQMTLSETGIDPESLQQLEDPLEMLQRSTELRHQMHHQTSSPTNRYVNNNLTSAAQYNFRVHQ